MGGGCWSTSTYTSYATSVGRNITTDAKGTVVLSNMCTQEAFRQVKLDQSLNPRNVVRECRDTEEHPNTIPVILALDVTGSMGSAATEVAKRLNSIMTSLYESVTDVEFLIMGIGDLYCDDAPIQASQFESDVRIAEQLDKIYFEGGGGGNMYESYSGAWYFGARHTDLDCWKRGKKGIIITLGDEPLNPYLSKSGIANVFGDNVQDDVQTEDIYEEASKKFDIYHLVVDDSHTCYKWYKDEIKKSWSKYLDGEHLLTVNLDTIAPTITDIVKQSSQNNDVVYLNSDAPTGGTKLNDNGEITW